MGAGTSESSPQKAITCTPVSVCIVTLCITYETIFCKTKRIFHVYIAQGYLTTSCPIHLHIKLCARIPPQKAYVIPTLCVDFISDIQSNIFITYLFFSFANLIYL